MMMVRSSQLVGVKDMKRFIGNMLSLLILICLGHTFVQAQAPSTITYQGRLTSAAGDPIISSQQVTFTIYPTPTSPTVLWTEILLVSPDAQGVFTAVLGTVTPLQGTLFNGNNRYITLKIEDDNEMVPRQLLTSVPYAISTTNIPDGSVTSAKLETGAVITDALADNAVTTDQIENNSLMAEDQLDEPGIAYKMSLPANQYQPLPSVGTNALDSITVNAPSAGYIHISGMSNIKFNHVNGTIDHFRCQVSVLPDTIIPNSYGFAMIEIPADLPTDTNYVLPINVHRPFQVITAGSYTYFFNAKMFSGGGNNDQYHSLQLTAMFFPTAYGMISQTPPPDDDDGDIVDTKKKQN